MFVGITNTPQPYAWGSPTAMAELFGRDPSGRPEAELWLGTHPASPSRLAEGGGDLRSLLESEGREPLPFLLKVLAAASPLSLQAHPTAEQAAAGFERENALGIPLDAPHRNYGDPHPKPELIVALRDGFRALCGFRPVSDVRGDLERLVSLGGGDAVQGWLDRLTGDDRIRPVFEWLISRGPGVDELVGKVSAVGRDAFPTVGMLADAYPGDPGVAIALMLHDVTLAADEGLYLPAGNIHAYLNGIGVELMRASDNVLRGGLTPKHVDVPELLSVLDFTPGPVPRLHPQRIGDGVTVWDPGVREFRLARAESTGAVPIDGPAIALCTAGRPTVSGATSSAVLAPGGALFVSEDERELAVTGGTVFVATTGAAA